MSEHSVFPGLFAALSPHRLTAIRDAAALIGDQASGLEIDERNRVVSVKLPADELEGVVRAIDELGARLADLFATATDEGVSLRLVFALDQAGCYVVITSPVAASGTYPPLSDLAPAAFTEESEIFELYGVRPRGDKPLNRVLMPPQAEGEFPLRSDHTRDTSGVRAPHYVRGAAFEFPFGPVRAAGYESLYIGLVSTGEEVLDLYLFHWHKHRGVERRLIGLDPQRALFFVERVEGLSAIGNGLAFCRAVETANAITVSPAAAATRAVALELERIYNHTNALALLCQATGLSVGQAQLEALLEHLLRLNLAVFGHRYLFGVLAVGGIARPPAVDELCSQLDSIVHRLQETVAALFRTNSHVDRLEAAGIVAPAVAKRMALVGPVARASGQAIDVRGDHPYPPYDRVEFEPAGEPGGDVFARARIFIAEIITSARLISQLAEETAASASEPVVIGEGHGLGWAESPRGEALSWVDLDDRGQLRQVRLRPAAVRNWRAFDDAARAQNVFTDIPIIEASFWQTVAGFAR